MSIYNTVPEVVDIEHYAGDTLTIHMKVPVGVIAGRVFTAQVRTTRGGKLDANFVVITNAEGADLVLVSADSTALTKRGDYSGFWDVQLAMPNGADPVTTLAHGKLEFFTDVTRRVSP